MPETNHLCDPAFMSSSVCSIIYSVFGATYDTVHTIIWLCIDRLWSAVHPANWYYNMFVKESLRRSWKVKSSVAVAAKAALGFEIPKRSRMSAKLKKRVSSKAAQINKNFFKVIQNI